LTEYVPLDLLPGTAAGSFICWPVYDEETARDRLGQLRGLGVEALALGGRHGVLGRRVLGKGHVGIVLMCMWRGVEAALKARRTDADRPSMMEEAELLRAANAAGVGPRLYAHSRDFLVMELLEGPYFGDWARAYMGDAGGFRDAVRELLRQVRSLDAAGLDHGELTRIRRHFIVTGGGPRVIDFESASIVRRPQNVTSTVQSMFLSPGFSRVVERWFPGVEREELLSALKDYKRRMSDEAFGVVLAALGL
jgi:putative serine/threonine protein kinase